MKTPEKLIFFICIMDAGNGRDRSLHLRAIHESPLQKQYGKCKKQKRSCANEKNKFVQKSETSEKIVFSSAYSLLLPVKHFTSSHSFAGFSCECRENANDRNGLARMEKGGFFRGLSFKIF